MTPLDAPNGAEFRYPLSAKAEALVERTLHLAAQHGIAPTSSHLLYALVTLDTPARASLSEFGFDLKAIQQAAELGRAEQPGILALVWSAADDQAERGRHQVRAVHLLVGLLRYQSHSLAISTLRAMGYDTNNARLKAIAASTERASTTRPAPPRSPNRPQRPRSAQPSTPRQPAAQDSKWSWIHDLAHNNHAAPPSTPSYPAPAPAPPAPPPDPYYTWGLEASAPPNTPPPTHATGEYPAVGQYPTQPNPALYVSGEYPAVHRTGSYPAVGDGAGHDGWGPAPGGGYPGAPLPPGFGGHAGAPGSPASVDGGGFGSYHEPHSFDDGFAFESPFSGVLYPDGAEPEPSMAAPAPSGLSEPRVNALGGGGLGATRAPMPNRPIPRRAPRSVPVPSPPPLSEPKPRHKLPSVASPPASTTPQPGAPKRAKRSRRSGRASSLAQRLRGRFGSRKPRLRPTQPEAPTPAKLAQALFGAPGLDPDALVREAQRVSDAEDDAPERLSRREREARARQRTLERKQRAHISKHLRPLVPLATPEPSPEPSPAAAPAAEAAPAAPTAAPAAAPASAPIDLDALLGALDTPAPAPHDEPDDDEDDAARRDEAAERAARLARRARRWRGGHDEDEEVDAEVEVEAAEETPPRPDPSRPVLSRAERRRLVDRYSIDPDVYPTLAEFGRNISLEAVQGHIDDLIGREHELAQLVDILNKRRNNNPLLVGPSGVGKTAIVEGLALNLVRHQIHSSGLSDSILVGLEMGRLLSGTHLRGSFSERLIRIKQEVRQANGRIIVFLDELHTWIGAGASGDGADASGELKTALARGHFPCIGATTEEEFKRFVESDLAFKRRFQVVDVSEPTREEAIAFIHGTLTRYSKHHDVAYDDGAVEASVVLSQRYMSEHRLPDKAFNLLDLAGSRARRLGQDHVSRDTIAHVLADQTGVPVEKLLMQDNERFLRMEEIMSASLIGHRHIIHTLSEVIRRNQAGFNADRPIGSFLFLGPTGVGKTETVKVLAEFLFRDRNAIVRLDMSEFSEAHTVSRMVGAPPGYVGYDQGGQLTEAVRHRPYQIILFDEIEKAHPDVLNIMLQLLDDGRLTDGRNRTVDFSNTVVILTSNLGSEHFTEGLARVTRGRIGFGLLGGDGMHADIDVSLTEEVEEAVLTTARDTLTPELWNRIDERLVFGALSRREVAKIADLLLRGSARRLGAERDITMTASDDVFEYLIDHGGYDPQLGARPMRQALQRLIEARVAELILHGDLCPGQRVSISAPDDELCFTIEGEPRA